MTGTHRYDVTVEWTGNTGEGTVNYRGYLRDHLVRSGAKPQLVGSSDPAFRGDPGRWTPEDLLVASLSQCHLLSYLHLAAVNGVVVTAYVDDAIGQLVVQPSGGGRFTSVTLRPTVTVADAAMIERAQRLHADAHATCFIASSVNFPVRHEPTAVVG
jgi:organic hydroperoxide reductase OsmC/OhrA